MKLTLEGELGEIEDFLLDLIVTDSVPPELEGPIIQGDRIYQTLERRLKEKEKERIEENIIVLPELRKDSVPLPEAEAKRDPDRTHELRKNPRVEEIVKKAKPAVSVPMAPEIKKQDHDRKLPTIYDIVVPRFEWERGCEKNYKRLSFIELPDGRVMLGYMSARVFTTKEKMLRLPFPLPAGYLRIAGMATNQITAVRQYQEYLSTVKGSVLPGELATVPQQDIKDPDAPFKPRLSGVINTHPGEDEKVEGSLEA